LALSVPPSRFTSRVGGGSAFFVRPMKRFTVILLALLVIVTGCASPELRQQRSQQLEQLRPLVGKTVREVADALHTPESLFIADDQPPGYYRAVTSNLVGPPESRILSIYVSREDAITSGGRRVEVSELFDKKAVGIEVWLARNHRAAWDACVGDVR